MFAYCENNPVCNYDPSGHIVVSYQSVEKHGMTKAIRRAKSFVRQGLIKIFTAMATPNSGNGHDTWTASLGVTASVSRFFGISETPVVSVDSGQNCAIQCSKGFQQGIGMGASFGPTLMLTNAETVYDLNGSSTSYGGTIVSGEGISIDYLMFESPVSGNDYHGIIISLGAGTEVEGHVAKSYTETFVSWNLYRALAQALQ